MDWASLPCVMCNKLIPMREEDYYDFLGKKLCTTCYECLSGGNYSKDPPIKHEIICEVPKIRPPVESVKETCNAHQKQYKFFCDACGLSLCLFCLPQHSLHGFSDLSLKAKELVTRLYTLEHLARYSIAYFEDRSLELQEIIQIIIELYQNANNKSNSSILSFLPAELDRMHKRLQEINPDLLGLSIDECKQMIEHGRDSIKEPRLRNYMHWCEWNDKCVHVIDLESMVRSTYMLPNSTILPLFCRSVSLPHKQILVCGGRKESSTPGLHAAFIIHLEENCRIEKIDDMLIGRSNHYMLSFRGYVYIIGGCDHLNQFTNKCERLKISSLKWETITSCNQIRDTCSAIGIEEQNCIYVFGGRIANNAISPTIEKYDISQDCWVSVNIRLPIMSSVNGVALIAPRRVLMFAGQDFENKPMNKCFILDLDKGRSEELEDLSSRGGCIVNEVAIYRDRVYALIFQGFTSKSLESWSFDTKKWRIDESR